MLRRYKVFWVAGIALAALLIAIRVALPEFIKDFVNKRLAALDSYDGSVADVDLALWRGAYRIDGIRIVKTGTKEPTPFFAGDRIDLSIEWRSLVRGSMVSEAVLLQPNVNFVRAENKDGSPDSRPAVAHDLVAGADFGPGTVREGAGRVGSRGVRHAGKVGRPAYGPLTRCPPNAPLR